MVAKGEGWVGQGGRKWVKIEKRKTKPNIGITELKVLLEAQMFGRFFHQMMYFVLLFPILMKILPFFYTVPLLLWLWFGNNISWFGKLFSHAVLKFIYYEIWHAHLKNIENMCPAWRLKLWSVLTRLRLTPGWGWALPGPWQIPACRICSREGPYAKISKPKHVFFPQTICYATFKLYSRLCLFRNIYIKTY